MRKSLCNESRSRVQPSRAFERAVYELVRRLDPAADVRFDHRVPDRDTGRLRQVDVWINAKLGGHIPVSVLVSCKNLKRRVGVPEVEELGAQIASTGASTGILYSSSGFTSTAVKKAKAHGLACCRLYQNQPADLPQVLVFRAFACTAAVKVELTSAIRVPGVLTRNDAFDLRVRNKDGERTVLECVEEGYRRGEKQALTSVTPGRFPSDWAHDDEFWDCVTGEMIAGIRVYGRWQRYVARVESHLLSGSYCLSNETFVGTQVDPWFDVRGGHIGAGWERLSDADATLTKPSVLMVLHCGNVRDALRDNVGNKTLPALAS